MNAKAESCNSRGPQHGQESEAPSEAPEDGAQQGQELGGKRVKFSEKWLQAGDNAIAACERMSQMAECPDQFYQLTNKTLVATQKRLVDRVAPPLVQAYLEADQSSRQTADDLYERLKAAQLQMDALVHLVVVAHASSGEEYGDSVSLRTALSSCTQSGLNITSTITEATCMRSLMEHLARKDYKSCIDEARLDSLRKVGIQKPEDYQTRLLCEVIARTCRMSGDATVLEEAATSLADLVSALLENGIVYDGQLKKELGFLKTLVDFKESEQTESKDYDVLEAAMGQHSGQ